MAAENIRQFIQERNLTQRAFAEELGAPEEVISKVLNGRRPITVNLIGKFFRRYGPVETARVFADARYVESSPN